MDDFKKEQQEKIENWLNSQKSKAEKAVADAKQSADEAKNKMITAVQ